MNYQQFGKMSIYKMLFITFALLTTLVGCQEDNTLTPTGKGKGRLALSVVTVDVTATDGIATTRAGNATYTAPDATLLTYTITNKDKEEIAYQKTGALTDLVLECGNYTLEAEYGENKMGTTPYLYATTDFTISLATTTTLSNFTVGLACAIIRPNLTAELLAQYKEGYTLTLSDGSNSITVTNGTNYFVPAAKDYTLSFSGTNQLGEAHTFSSSVANASPQTRYNLNCSSTPLPQFTLPTQIDGDIWSKRIYITPITAANISNANGVATDKIINNIVYEASANGTTDWKQATTENNRLVIKGLNAATAYTIRARFATAVSSNAQMVTTENATDVPNGDFEDLVQTINISGMNDGGEYTHTLIGGTYQNTTNILIKEPTNWSSINATTCNYNGANTKNSWFVIPSTFNSTIECTVTAPRDKTWGGGWTKTPDMYSNLTASNGNNAMVVRNVAWDNNGTNPARDKDTKTSNNYYSNNKPSSIANRSAGELFLYTNSSEGINFSSRPATLKGFYKYMNNVDANEAGTATIELWNEATNIGGGNVRLTPQSDYKEFNVNIEYNNPTLKATNLKIKFKSSDVSTIQTTDRGEKEQCSYGATLFIDNLSFLYE